MPHTNQLTTSVFFFPKIRTFISFFRRVPLGVFFSFQHLITKKQNKPKNPHFDQTDSSGSDGLWEKAGARVVQQWRARGGLEEGSRRAATGAQAGDVTFLHRAAASRVARSASRSTRATLDDRERTRAGVSGRSASSPAAGAPGAPGAPQRPRPALLLGLLSVPAPAASVQPGKCPPSCPHPRLAQERASRTRL